MATLSYATVKVEKEDGITWVILNRPEKRNAMNPQLHFDMLDAITELEVDDETKVMVLTGAGDSWCAGQDLREYFRGLENNPKERRRAGWSSQQWRWQKLYMFPKPTIAMVNGFCFGGAFTPLVACDFAIAAEEAIFGLSEVNWGILPGGLVTKVVSDIMSYRDGLYYCMTGDSFDGKKAAELRLVNYAVPRAQLREETIKLAKKLMEKNPWALKGCKQAFKTVRTMDYAQAEDYLSVKSMEIRATDKERGREKGMQQFLDDKSYRPGLGAYDRNK
ncbi:MAG: p-hydroxycinnamoyl CoA hydratase/lyase [Deltaproteobacteria bacterium]|nr:p-hydroxycinnamoyl CoA hydratase/lyase [Deltaproteobacteria bacterium]